MLDVGSSALHAHDACSHGSNETVSTKTKVLAYLGELKKDEFVPVKKLIYDLGLRFTTAKNVLTALEEEWIVEKRIVNKRGIIASFRIMPTAVMQRKVNGVATVNHPDGDYVPFVPPEWEASYGQHPYGL
jgi:hypothetical protein